MAEWAWSGWALSFQSAHQQESQPELNQREMRQQEADPMEDSRKPDNSKRVQQLEWPLFPTPTFASIQVSGYEMYNNSLYYTVSIEMSGGFKWSVLKNYEEFANLHEILLSSFKGIDRSLFPHRKRFGSHKLQNITDMQLRLNAYLTSVLKYFIIPPPQILQFLEYRFSDILNITQTLSALFYDKGEEFLETNSMVAFSPLQLHCVCQRLVLPIDSDPHSVKEDFGHLLDFLQQLRKIKVCHPKRQVFKLAPDVKLKFDLSIMKSLDTLVLQSINLELIEGLGNIPECLTTLAVHGGLNAMRDILKHISLIPTTGNAPVKWPLLKVIDFSDNEITTIDSSLLLTPNLEVLNVRNNMIKDVDNLSELPLLRILDLTNNRIASLRDLHCRLGNITTLCLAKNSLNSLQGLEKCYSVVCLDIQDNNLNKVADLAPLSTLPLLEQLMIKGNPFTEAPFYRQKVFGQLSKIAPQLAVDGKPPSSDELKVAQSMASKDSTKKVHKSKKTAIRKAPIKGDEDEETVETNHKKKSAEPGLAGARRNIEEMRKEGGDNWLSLLNQQQTESSPLVIHKKRKHKKGSKKKVQTAVNIISSSSGGDIDSSSEFTKKQPTSVTGTATGLPSPHLIQILGTRECSSIPWSCSVSVTECKESLPKFTHQQMDDYIMTAAMEPCVVIVDIGLGRITEDYIVPGTAGKNRNTRDLTFLRSVRVHEGHILAISIELSTIVTAASWVVYSFKDYPSLADMYLLLSRKLKLVDEITVPSPVLLAKQMSIPVVSDDPDTEPEDSEHIDGNGNEKNEEKVAKQEAVVQTATSTESESEEPTLVSLKQRREKYSGPVNKPRFENTEFQKFLMKKVVRDSSEVILWVCWCGMCLPGTVPTQLEGAVVISNECVYLLEVKGYQIWNWSDDKRLPLSPLTCMKLEHLSRITVTGMFNHSLYIEVHQALPITSFVIFTDNSEQCQNLVVQLQAALDASSLDYKVMDALEVKKMKKTSGIVFVSPDHYSGNRLKEWLSRDRTNVRLANFVSTQMDKKAVGMYEVELQQSCKELARSFDIEQYLVVNTIDSSENCKLHTLILVATNTHLTLFEESFISGPGLRSTPVKYSFPPLSIVHHQKISSIKSIKLCDKPNFIHSPSDPMYQVSIEFEQHVGAPWYFCTRDFASLNLTLGYIQQQWNTLLSNNSTLINATSSSLPYFANLSEIPLQSPKQEHSHKSGVPLLVKSKALLNFNSLSYWEKNEKFNQHISQANYLKHDEMIVVSALVYCVPAVDKKQEVEACIIISNYAIYLVSEVNSIRQWLDAGGISSFSRMSLLNPDTEYSLQCFYRMWLSDIRMIDVNCLSLSLCLHETRPGVDIVVLTCSAQVTASLISALASKIKIKSKDKEQDGQILQDFVDIADDPFGEEDADTGVDNPPSPSSVRPSVEFSVADDKLLMNFKLHLVEVQPDVARRSSIHKCSESMQIICSQIMLLAEQLRVRDSVLLHYRPHLVLVTNYGLFVCSHSSLPNNTPCLLLNTPSNIAVKKWSRIDDVSHVQLSSDAIHKAPKIQITLKPSKKSEELTQLSLFPLSRTQGYIFVNQLRLIWAERAGHALQTSYIE